MNLTMVEKEVESWQSEDQDQLSAFLSVLRLKRNPNHSKHLAKRLDDNTPANWLTLSALKANLAKG